MARPPEFVASVTLWRSGVMLKALAVGIGLCASECLDVRLGGYWKELFQNL